MITELRISVLVDNAADSGLQPEHGLSFWIEADDQKILFDTGPGEVLRFNAARLGIELNRVHAIALSHGHRDHTGGVSAALAAAGHAIVHMHPLAFESKYSKRERGSARRIRIPDEVASDLLERNYSLACNSSPAQIAPGVFLTGEIPRLTASGDHCELFLDEECTRTDAVTDEQALFIESRRGIVVIVGCAHRGVANTLDYISKLAGANSMHALLGGMHLEKASEGTIARVAEAIERYRIELVAPCHCTGARATAELRRRLGAKVMECMAGSCFTFSNGQLDESAKCGLRSRELEV